MRIALLPLDERPVNTRLVRDVASLASSEVLLPPDSALPRFRLPGDPAALAGWLGTALDTCQAAVLSIEMLCFGGLIASRTSTDSAVDALQRLALLPLLRASHPDVHLAAVSLVMRASDSYDNTEEPDYWSRHGRELHGLGGTLHRAFAADAAGRPEPPEVNDLPAALVADFAQRRLRNHLVNLECLSLRAHHHLDTLVITADDTAVWSAGSTEQLWLRHWRRALAIEDTVPLYPGADEVGAVLVAKTLNRGRSPVRVRIATAEPAGLAVVPPYENGPVRETLELQVTAVGGLVVPPDEAADLVLVVHPPNGHGEDWYGRTPPAPDPDAATATAELVAREVSGGLPVAVADIRHTNGGDPLLVAALHERGLVEPLVGYAGWNTCSNAIGSTLAAAVTVVAARAQGCADEHARRRLVLHRMVEDVGYQSIVRTRLTQSSPSPENEADAERLLPLAHDLLADYLAWLEPSGQARLDGMRFPWNRLFEVDFDLQLGGG